MDVNLTCVEGKHVAKRPKLDIPLSEQVLMSTIPYHSIEYEEQVSKPFDASVPTSICIIITIIIINIYLYFIAFQSLS